ncbi:DUF882 domain-containing protein [Aeromonas simiae]|uniref:DUF882 domain-containing protein n=1 Tax=Aeromonas simiae TaxID=218936 RepID=UPI0005AA7684|nr:DUF882 domain-containing protein [Aeromonas simiae]MDO2947531.1 DUF882 domain-containing protein [Aeromonas simiae]MDO2951622.1 DUF882 domain-containing protein [Aeromonas simiae]MDO2955091.1 DUF882 domain-containing protein [Aeromonas simiae]
MLDKGISRRQLLLGSGLLLTAGLLPQTAQASRSTTSRELVIHNLNTGEKVRASYWENGRYLPDGLAELNHILRDHRRNEVFDIDRKLFDQLFLLQHKLGRKGQIELISGYRSLATNNQKHRHSRGVAKRSYHTLGQAVDIRMPGVQLAHLRQAALQLSVGGVGYYPNDNFVHLDTGPVRRW